MEIRKIKNVVFRDKMFVAKNVAMDLVIGQMMPVVRKIKCAYIMKLKQIVVKMEKSVYQQDVVRNQRFAERSVVKTDVMTPGMIVAKE